MGKRLAGREAASNKLNQPLRMSHSSDAAGKELHLIPKVWDQSAIIPLVDYRRAVIKVTP